MSTFWQRILTVAAGAGIVVAGALTGTAAVLVPLGLSVAAWAVPHPAGRQGGGAAAGHRAGDRGRVSRLQVAAR
jgi:hypothetical protein